MRRRPTRLLLFGAAIVVTLCYPGKALVTDAEGFTSAPLTRRRAGSEKSTSLTTSFRRSRMNTNAMSGSLGRRRRDRQTYIRAKQCLAVRRTHRLALASWPQPDHRHGRNRDGL
jgi:hypothetical protein